MPVGEVVTSELGNATLWTTLISVGLSSALWGVVLGGFVKWYRSKRAFDDKESETKLKTETTRKAEDKNHQDYLNHQFREQIDGGQHRIDKIMSQYDKLEEENEKLKHFSIDQEREIMKREVQISLLQEEVAKKSERIQELERQSNERGYRRKNPHG